MIRDTGTDNRDSISDAYYIPSVLDHWTVFSQFGIQFGSLYLP